jgi:DNA-binding NtrC family response regulator
VDDEEVVRRSVERTLCPPEFEVDAFSSGNLAILALQEKQYDVAITDLKMPGMNGISVLKAIHVLQPELPVLMITGYGSIDTAVEAMKSGAFDYITKPFTPDEFLAKVREALELRPLRSKVAGEMETLDQFDEILGRSPAMQEVYSRIRRVAATDSTVLISGESGTGKELVARSIHRHSLRREKPFVAVDCTALAESLLESELFGHVKGSFTGAVGTKIGLFEVANKGTLFLDEVSNLSFTVQAKLLRALQERMITPAGGTKSMPIDIRLIAASNQNLQEMVAQKLFREDLFFRINVIPFQLPPLRDREGDLFLLASSFLAKYAAKTSKAIDRLSREALDHLESYSFPGNVRELENIIERAVVLCAGREIEKYDLGLDFASEVPPSYVPRTAEELKFLKKRVREQAVLPAEKAFVLAALERCNWNVTHAAEDTGMLRQNFQALLRKHEIWADEKGTEQEGDALRMVEQDHV